MGFKVLTASNPLFPFLMSLLQTQYKTQRVMPKDIHCRMCIIVKIGNDQNISPRKKQWLTKLLYSHRYNII